MSAIQVNVAPGFPWRGRLEDLGLSWPPPERIVIVERAGKLRGFDASHPSTTDEGELYTRLSLVEIPERLAVYGFALQPVRSA